MTTEPAKPESLSEEAPCPYCGETAVVEYPQKGCPCCHPNTLLATIAERDKTIEELKAESEGRRKTLIDKEGEGRSEWRRAEIAEVKNARLRKALEKYGGIPTEALENGVFKRLVDALELIAKLRGMTLLGPDYDDSGERLHMQGASKAYDQCAGAAEKALAALKPEGE